MTQLVKQRPLAVWFLFLAGAVTGGIGSSLMEPQLLLAEPDNLNGRKFAELERMVAAHNELLQVISRDETGLHIADRVEIQCDASRGDSPALTVCGSGGTALKVTGDPGIDPLMTVMPLEHKQALRVEGPTLFTGDAGPNTPLVALDPVMLDPGKAEFVINGPTLFTGDAGPDMPLVAFDPVMLHPGKSEVQVLGGGLSVVGGDRALCFHPDRVELLVDCGDPEAEVFGVFGVDDAGGFLNVRNILAETIEASSILETGKPGSF